MPELRTFSSTPRSKTSAVQILRLAERQHGLVSRQQLLSCGLSSSTIIRWTLNGRLQRVHPGVYTVGHRAIGIEGRLVAALLHAGDEAVLSHTTAAWCWELLAVEPRIVHVSVPGRPRPAAGIRIHRPREIERAEHRGLPVSTVPRTLLDIAAVVRFRVLRRAVAEADYRRLLDRDAVEAVLGRGHPGSAALRRALSRHLPDLARTLSVLEERFLGLCEAAALPPPETNVGVEGMMVDALWREQRLVVELDGHAAHATPAAVERDRRRELVLRSACFDVHRYTWAQITRQPQAVAADLRSALARR